MLGRSRVTSVPLVHSITSSARASSVGGTVSPSALAVLRLMTSSCLVGNSMGPDMIAIEMKHRQSHRVCQRDNVRSLGKICLFQARAEYRQRRSHRSGNATVEKPDH